MAFMSNEREVSLIVWTKNPRPAERASAKEKAVRKLVNSKVFPCFLEN